MGKSLRVFCLFIFLVNLLLASNVLAGSLADIEVSAAAVHLSPLASVHGLRLVVTGPGGFQHEEHFDSSSSILFPLGPGLADGHYDYELISLAPARLRQGEAKATSLVPRLRQSGVFTVRSGVGVADSLLEDRPTKDIVNADDVIIEGGLCVGPQCANGEVFGDDTVRLKAARLRLHFDDTSTDPGFPANDWRLVANDTSSGGGSYFAIEDSTGSNQVFRVDAGAPENALRVDSTGEVGLGTATPLADLHLVSGDTPTLRLEQDNSLGLGAQAFDVEVDEDGLRIDDGTAATVPFQIEAGASTDSLFIEADGDVGIGTSSPGTALHVLGSGTPQTPSNSSVLARVQNNGTSGVGAILSVLSSDTGNAQVWLGDAAQDNAGRIVYRNNSDTMSFFVTNTERLRIDSSGRLCIGCYDALGVNIRHASGATLTGGTWVDASSRSLKKDISDLGTVDALAALADLSPVRYAYKEVPGDERLGFIAEDVPAIVATQDRKGLAAMDIVAVLTKVTQEQQKIIERLSERLEKLEGAE